ncbi:hypothetical protein BASA61_005748 [Batrachochytrium salamandrivorans]|nr:hypothetical protein BASA60_001853 [Batrachochytrium salamandrivorans]KAH6589044.1 hypothetical protein BASA61_005748 [Batrachochytrium salamandrivorans]KAH9272008.1 hypothetical protein BASA83_005854 [Batrachochytrium salamandrivorans]
MDTLPTELLAYILGLLDFEEQFPRLPTVNSRWRAALNSIRVLRIKATPQVKRAGLNTIVASFPLLQELRIEPTDHVHDLALVHQIALQFNGHPSIRSIVSSSDAIIKGILCGCPNLESICLPAEPVVHNDDDDMIYESQLDGSESPLANAIETLTNQPSRSFDFGALGPRGRRNVGLILRALPRLRCLTIDGPSFWRRQTIIGQDISASYADTFSSSLESLKMTSMNSWTMVSFLCWLECYSASTANNSSRIGSTSSSTLPLFRERLHVTAPLLNLKHLYLDIDYLHFPENGIKALAGGCPRLEALKIKFGTLPHDSIFDIATHMTSLKRLSLSKCVFWFVSQNWAQLCTFLASHLKMGTRQGSVEENNPSGLSVLSFNMCTIQLLEEARWHSVFEQLSQTPSKPFLGLKQLKILDTCETRVDASILHTLVVMFPALDVLRLDVTSDCFPAFDAVYLDSLRRGFKGLSTLELRMGKERIRGDPTKLPTVIQADQSIYMPRLKRLSVWCFGIFPHFLLSCNVGTIEELVINYPVVVVSGLGFGVNEGRVSEMGPQSILTVDKPPQVKYTRFPRLQMLEIRGLSNAAHAICLSVLDMIGTDAPVLKSLTLAALCHATSPLPLHYLTHLAKSSPNLTFLNTSGFIFPTGGFTFLRCEWPHLQTLELMGACSIGTLTSEWERDNLEPFMQSHRYLYRLALGISHLSVPGFELLSATELMARLTLRGNLLSTDFDSGFVRMVKTANIAIYHRFGMYLRSKYCWLREVVIRGPSETKL